MAEENFGRAGGWLIYVAPDPPEQTEDAVVRYEVEIVGHQAPYKWEVQRWLPGATVHSFPNSDCRGEADTYEDALFAAADIAREVEWKRVHDSTKRTEHLFSAPLKVNLGSYLGPAEGPMEPEPQ